MNSDPTTTHTRLQITADQVRVYADIADDHNPLHLDDEFARSRGFTGPIAHGLLTLGLVSAELEVRWTDRWRTGGHLDVRFTAPVPVGAVLDLALQTVPADDSPGRDRVEVTVSCAGAVVLSGTADVGAAT